jgi:tetratricopeptide (TPR) repeat protein/tRNA A-37 threonylcarbamoyl transferase component Bud32
MPTCPTGEELHRFLDRDDPALGEDRRRDIEAHVEECSRCQSLLEHWIRDLEAGLRRCAFPSSAGRKGATQTAPTSFQGKNGLTATATHSGSGRGAGAGVPGGPTAECPEHPATETDAPPAASPGPDEMSPESEGQGPRPSEVTVPGYDVLSVLGEGGMSTVYLARHLALKRQVALKVLRADRVADPERRYRVLAEAEAIARLQHPHIVQIFEVGEWRPPGQATPQPYLALEHLSGGSLGQVLHGQGVIKPAEAARLIAVLGRAVHVAHQAGIVHRDLKPSNVLFDLDGTPKVADFGLAKRLGRTDGQTETGQVMGTPSYMAPEQARGLTKEIGPAADVYALGAILYEMLTWRPPFKAPTPAETLMQVLHEDPVPPSRLQSRIPRDLETICLKCLAKEPHRRYASAAALADDLGRYLAGETIRARRTPVWERGWKWARRRPAAAALVAIGLVASVALTGAFSYYNRSETRRLTGLRLESEDLLFRGRDGLARKDWASGRLALSKVLTKIEAEPRLADLRARAVDTLEQINRRQADQEAWEGDRQRHLQFLRRRNDALFHETRFTGLDLPGNLEQTRESARAALDIFAKAGPDGTWTPQPLPASLTPQEQTEVTEDCYVLLLILAGAMTQPEQGLKVLDQAVRWHPATRAYHLRRAACLARLGDAAGAGRERGAAGSLPPATDFDHFLTGLEWYERGLWEEALRDFDAVLRHHPNHFWAQCLSAICYLQLRRPLEAKAALHACLNQEPDFAWLYLLRGFASGQVGSKYTGVVGPATGTGDLAGKAEDHFAAAEEDYARAMALLERKPAAELQYVLLVNRGLLRWQRHDPDRAAADLREAIRLDPRHYQAYAGLAQVLQQQGRPDEAVAQFTQAIALRPGLAALHRGRAEVNQGRRPLSIKQVDAALRDLDEAVRLESPVNPVLGRDHTNRARLLERCGRPEEALAACDAALRAVPDDADAHRLRIGVLLVLQRYDDVIRSCAAVLANRPTAEVFELRGLARDRRGDFAGAIDDYTQALAQRPGRPELWVRRGWDHLVIYAARLALEDFERALRLDPSNADALGGRGSARALLGQHRAAVADAEESLRHGEPDARTYYLAGRIYVRAASAAAGEVRQSGRAAVSRTTSYQDRAVALIREAVRRKPPAQRAAFVREQVLTDSALRPILRRLKFEGLIEPTAAAAR